MNHERHYLNIVSNGPLMIARVPWKTTKKERRANWKTILKALTVVMQQHGLKQKDIYSVDGLVDGVSDPEPLVSRDFRSRLDRTYENKADYFKEFYLYDFVNGEFKLIRKGTKNAT